MLALPVVMLARLALLLSAIATVNAIATGTAPPISYYANVSNVNSLEERRVLATGVDTPFLHFLCNGTQSVAECGAHCVAFGNATYRCKSFTRFKPSGACLGHSDISWLPMTTDATRDAGLIDSGRVAWPCLNAGDCSMNGVCAADGECVCDAGWGGRQCGELVLAPVDFEVLGFNPIANGSNMSSWGGGAWFAEGAWHLWASRLDNHCGIASYLLNSRVVHAVADTVTGPFTEAESVVPPFAHEPVIARAPNGSFVLMTVHGPLNGFAECVCTDGTSRGCNGCNNSCHPAQPVLSVADAPGGPWRSSQVPPPVGPNSTAGHMENPSIWITATGALYGMGRGGMAAYASDWANFATWSKTPPGGAHSFISGSNDCEDPFIYQDARGGFHALMHLLEGPHYCQGLLCNVGVHAFSEDAIAWFFSGVAYTNAVNFTDGRSVQLVRRERPHLVFASRTNLTPVALINSAVWPNSGDRSFTLVQGVA